MIWSLGQFDTDITYLLSVPWYSIVMIWNDYQQNDLLKVLFSAFE